MEQNLSCGTASHLATQEFPNVLRNQISLPCSQEPTISHYPEPDESSPYHPVLIFEDQDDV
jgi:hypothetical protein